ncbi:MAG: CehA/McbA family metallohydrolase [bacterium]|nr:MAG: CehA/McbA family metallohydrolase [bacterium]
MKFKPTIKTLAAFSLTILLLISCSKTPKEIVYSTLQFEILDKNSREPIPAKLVFILDEDKEPDLNIAKAKGICAERTGFYTAYGTGSVEIPLGTYEVYASRGMEYSIDKQKVKIKKGKITQATWQIRREIDSEGFVFCDLHMHTTNSDGKPTPEERVTTLVGEGIEFAAITDHNFVTDVSPEVQALGVDKWIKTCPGNEYTTSIGHYNVYPLSPEQPFFEHQTWDARVQFGYVRALQGSVVLQVNHPRSYGLDYFGHFNLNPITAETDHPQFSWDFDAMEIMNGAAGWGYFTGSENKISVWEDWFNFLNKDFRTTGIGTSDTHGSVGAPAGVPGNYVMTNAQTPADIDPEQIAKNIIDHRVAVSRGIFVNLVANGEYPVGSELIVENGEVELLVQVQASSWAQADRVTIYGNGREVWSEPIERSNGSQKFEKSIAFQPKVDTWYLAKAEGSDNMWPIVPNTSLGTVTPIGFTNPIWVDIDGDGFKSERDRAKVMLAEVDKDIEKFQQLVSESDWVLQKQFYALTSKNSAFERELIKQFVDSDKDFARELAYKRLYEMRDDQSISLLRKARQSAAGEKDRLLAATYLATLSDSHHWIHFTRDSVNIDDSELMSKQLEILALNRYVREWQIIATFPNENNKGLETVYGPEKGIDLQKEETGKDGVQLKWQLALAEEDGYINFLKYYDPFEYSVAYAYTVLNVPEEMETVLLFGSDDGAAVWQNNNQIYYRFIRRSPKPNQEIIPITLEQGENRFLVKVENARGDSGFYFELLDPANSLKLN